ncbi:unnamed protein product [Trichobilharzia szidati]|nr:unnamed protein product [Trichobilharzia szidati]
MKRKRLSSSHCCYSVIHKKEECDTSINTDKEVTLDLLDNIGPNQLCSILHEVIHELFSTSHLIFIQRLNSSTMSLINEYVCQMTNNSCTRESRTAKNANLKVKSKRVTTVNRMNKYFIFHSYNENESTKHSVRSFVIKVDSIRNMELRNLFLLEKPTVKKPKFVVAYLVCESASLENGTLISFCLTKFLLSDQKILEMLSTKLQSLSVVTTEGSQSPTQPTQKCHSSPQYSPSAEVRESTCFNLVKLSHSLLHQMTEKANYSFGILMFNIDDSDRLLCIASSDDLFVGEQKVEIHKDDFEKHLNFFENSTTQEFEETVLTKVLRKVLDEKAWNFCKSSQKKFFRLINLGSFSYDYHIQDNITQRLADSPTASITIFYLVVYLWSVPTGEYSENLNGFAVDSGNENVQISNLLDIHRKRLYEGCRLQYLSNCNKFYEVFHKVLANFSRIESETNLFENIADSLKKLINFDSISIYHFDKNEQEWIEELNQYPLKIQMVRKQRWNNSKWMLEDLFKQINVDMETLKTDRIEDVSRFINQLDINVYWIDMFSSGASHSTLIELRKCNVKEKFSKYDRYLLSCTIINFLSVLLRQTYLNEELHIMKSKNKVNTEMIAYHMKIPENEISQLANKNSRILTELHPDYNQLNFCIRSVGEKDSTEAIMIMFDTLGFIDEWKIHRPTLACFILTVKKNYRSPAYHNWMHAFTVGHMAYLALTIDSQLTNQYLDEIERLALFVGALCHDIDHRGFNNSYQVFTKSPLAALYGHRGSILEQHHIDQTMRILSLKGCNIFSQMTKQQYERLKYLLKQIILATDLCQHISLMPEIIQVTGKMYNPSNVKHRELLLSLLVTACDLNDQCKDWYNTREAAKLIYHEFFIQGDLEKSWNLTPQPSLDRNKAFIPELQVYFLDSIVLPCFKALSSVLPKFQPTISTIQSNQQIWRMICKTVEENQLCDYTNEALFSGHYDTLIEGYIATLCKT